MSGAAHTDRRALIGGALLLPVVAAAACQPEALPAKATEGLSPRFVEMVSALDAARSAEVAFYASVYRPAIDGYDDAVEAIPAPSLRVWDMPSIGAEKVSDRRSANRYREMVSKEGWSAGFKPGFAERVEAFVAAADEHDRLSAEQAARFDVRRIEDRFNHLQGERFSLEHMVMISPSEVKADLLYKLTLFETLEEDDAVGDLVGPLVADVRRLLSGEAA